MIDLREKSEYRMLDIARMVCAFLVVCVHIPLLGSDAQGIFAEHWNFIISKGFSRTAVPFFFISSGFFLFKKIPEESMDWKAIRKFILHILALYLIWSIIYLPLQMWEFMMRQMSLKEMIRTYCYHFIFSGSYVHLWYLPALIVATLMTAWGLAHRISLEKLLGISCIFYMIGLFGNSWYGLITLKVFPFPWIAKFYQGLLTVFGTTRNGIFEGFLFVTFGAYCAHRKIQISSGKVGVIGCISFALMIAENLILNHYGISYKYDLKLFLVPTVCCFFLYCANAEIRTENSIYRILRFCASVIYFVQLWVEFFVLKLSTMMQWNVTSSCMEYIFVVFGALTIGIVAWNLSKYKYFHWMKSLF